MHLLRFRLPALLTIVLFTSATLRAQVYWDGTGSGVVGGGTGAWSTSSARWSSTSGGSSYSVWANGGDAVFQNTAGTVTVSGGVTVGDITFGVSGYTITGSTLTLGASSAIGTGAFDATLASRLSGSAGFTKNGSGTLTLTNVNNNYTGTTSIHNGILLVSANTNLGDPTAGVAIDGGVLKLDTSFDTARSVTLGAEGGSINLVGTGTSSNFSGVISGTGQLSKTGSGTLTLSNIANTYSGGTTIDTGTLAVSANGNLGDTAGGITFAGGRLLYTAGFNFSRAVTLSTDGGKVDTGSFNANWTGALSGSTDLEKLGTGRLLLSGSNTGFTGQLIITAGSIRVTSNNALGSSASGATVAAEAGLELDGGISIVAEPLTLNGTGVSSLGALRNISGANTYGGTITLASASEIQTGSAGSLALPGGIGGAFALTFDGAGATTASGVISTASLIKNGSGTLTLSGANSYGGGTTVHDGTLAVSADAHLGNASGGLTFTGGTLQLGASFDSARAIALSTGGGTIDTNGFNSTFSGLLSGSTALTKSGGGTLTLSNSANTYSGTLTVDAGSLALTHGTALASATLSVSSGASTTFGGLSAVTLGGLAGDGDIAFPTSNSSPLTLTVGGNNADTIFNGLIAGPSGVTGYGSLTKTGTGTLTLGNAANNYAGGASAAYTTIEGGLIQFSSLGNFGSSTIKLNGGGLLWATGTTTDISSKLNSIGSSGGTFQIDSGTVSFASDLPFSSSSITKTGNGTLAFTVDNPNFSGSVNASAGTLRIDTGNALSDSVVSATGGNVSFGPSVTTARFNGLSGTGEIALVNTAGSPAVVGLSIGGSGVPGVASSFGGVLSGAGSLTLAQSTTNFTLTGSNTFTGGLTVTQGTLQLGNSGTVLADSLPVTVNSGTFALGTSGETIGTLAGTVSVGSRVLLGASTLTLAGNGDSAYAGIISSTSTNGGLTKTGSGILTLSNRNTFTGTTSITAGTLNLTNISALESSPVALTGTGALSFTGITASFVGGLSGTRPIVLTNAANSAVTLIVGQATNSTSTYEGALSGLGGLQKSGTGTLTLTADHTFAGATTIAGGTLRIGDGGETGSVTGSIANSAALIFNRSNGLTYSGAISGSGSITQAGSGTLTLTGGNSYTGSLTVSAGTIVFGSAGAMSGTGRNIAVASGATVAAGFAINSTFLGRITSGSAGTFALGADSANNLNFSTGSHSSASLGATGGFTYSGTLTPAGTTYRLGGGGGTLTVSSALTGGNALVISGPGSVVLSGSNSHSGGTTISFGTAHASHASAFGTGAVNVQGAGARLILDGTTMANAVTVQSSGALSGIGGVGALTVSGGGISPGASPGTMTAGATTFGPAGSYTWEINSATGIIGTNTDLLSIAGALTITATAAEKFTISLVSLTSGNTAGLLGGFNPAQNYSYTIASATGGILGFDTADFAINASGFQNALGGGTWSLALSDSNRNLDLNFTASAIPEPGTYAALFGIAALGFATWRRRHRA